MRRQRWQDWIVWALITVAVTVGLLAFRIRLDKTHVALAYLLLVLAGSARSGHRIGLALSAVAFVLFDWFFLAPYGNLSVTNPLDWLVLAAFLIVSVVAAQLLYRLQVEAETARQRAAEIDRFATLGAETLNLPRADKALAAIAEVIRTTLELANCRIHTRPAHPRPGEPPGDSVVAWVAESGRVAVRQDDGTTHVSELAELPAVLGERAREVFLPLQVGGRIVGVLELEGRGPIVSEAAQQRFLTALAYYAALAVERVRLEAEAGRTEALREADRMKDALLASVSHDLRTPLTTIKALAHDLAAHDDRAIIIEEEADRLNRLVADLLDLSRLQGGVSPAAIELNPVDELIAAVVQRVSGALGARELRVHLEGGGTLLVGKFDLAGAARVLVNLVENAHKYSPPDTAIEIDVRQRNRVIEITVSDRGPGVDKAERERIFEPFYRPAGSSPDVGGAGLGLAIARKLAESQHGALTYRPRAGGGSEFLLTLPAADVFLPTGESWDR